ncbi:hypothetical protein [Micromonospora sp.]|uniref:hypothetical protein n=1 Tax=Micromonospora sp. TaxID=1876 RepID=UPI003B3AC95D
MARRAAQVQPGSASSFVVFVAVCAAGAALLLAIMAAADGLALQIASGFGATALLVVVTMASVAYAIQRRRAATGQLGS